MEQKATGRSTPVLPLGGEKLCVLTMKFCCRGDQEYMTGTEATALRVFRGMTCLGNSEKLLSTVHWRHTHTCSHRVCTHTQTHVPTSRVPLSEPTDVMM